MNSVQLTGRVKLKKDKEKMIFGEDGSLTIDFVLVVPKSALSNELTEVMVSADRKRFYNIVSNNEILDITGSVRTDSWPVDKDGNWVKDAKRDPKTNKIIDTNVKAWASKMYVNAESIKGTTVEEIKNRREAAKQIMSGSVTI